MITLALSPYGSDQEVARFVLGYLNDPKAFRELEEQLERAIGRKPTRAKRLFSAMYRALQAEAELTR